MYEDEGPLVKLAPTKSTVSYERQQRLSFFAI